MLSCKLQNNILKSNFCGYSLPDIVKIYLINYDDVENVEADIPVTGAQTTNCSEVSDIKLVDDADVYVIEPNTGASFSDTLTLGNNGNKYRVHSITWVNPGGYDACAHDATDSLALGKYIAIVKTAEGSYLMLGRLAGLEASEQTLNGGADNSGVSTTLSGNQTESAVPLSATAVTKLESLVHEDE